MTVTSPASQDFASPRAFDTDTVPLFHHQPTDNMKFWEFCVATILAAAAAGVAFAGPSVCRGIYGSAKCCDADDYGVATRNCKTVPRRPRNPADFRAMCASGGMTPWCCVLPVPGRVLCKKPKGV
ncbi:Hydrophobin 5 [Tolypocladium paradoxum]|uniref:Hydrophobin 5 n=1 Tax=Tolypocladium paradoxum TaxID=94208 RepID=A0A2S4L7L2_9HYPO|nr:Hydrophobin 5 [Tolypocladium paradoxum]